MISLHRFLCFVSSIMQGNLDAKNTTLFDLFRFPYDTGDSVAEEVADESVSPIIQANPQTKYTTLFHLFHFPHNTGDPVAEEVADDFVDFCVSNADKEKSGEIDYELLVKTFFEKDQGINAAL